MKHLVDMSWTENFAFETELDGHRIVVDISEEEGGNDHGPRPKKLMLASLAGCTGIDVIMILNKLKVFPEKFNVHIEADVTEENPKHYYKVKVIYQFKGKNLPMDKLEKAVDLSVTKYCGVSAVYKKVMDFKTEIKITE